MSLLNIKHLSKSFHSRPILKNVSFAVNEHEILSLIGPSGSGKTTLLKIILGLITPDLGQIIKDDTLKISYLPQQLNIDPSFPLQVRRFLWQRKNNACSEHFFAEIIKLTHIETLLNRPLFSVSGGEKQKILLAYAMLAQPTLMILDEPSQGLDIEGQRRLYQSIEQFREIHNCSILMVSHDLNFVMASTDKVICLNGHICCQGSPDRIITEPSFLNLFGDDFKKLAIYQHHHDHQH